MSNDILERTRAAIADVFGDYISENPDRRREIIESATYVGDEDPGQWSPRAAVVIHTESGIPNGAYDDPRVFEKWFAVSDKLGTHFCEHVNGAVIAVWPV